MLKGGIGVDLEKLGKMLEIAQQFQDQSYWQGPAYFPRSQEEQSSIFPSSSENQFPLVDVLESDEEVLVLIDLPGLKKEEIQLYVSGDYLTIKGPPYEFRSEGKSFVISERLHKNFERTIKLPDNTIPSKITSRLKDGVLEIEIPRSATIQKTIEIE